MSQAFIRESAANALVRTTRESAENRAEVYRTIERDYDFAVREGRGGWMIARLTKDGTFDSWVED